MGFLERAVKGINWFLGRRKENRIQCLCAIPDATEHNLALSHRVVVSAIRDAGRSSSCMYIHVSEVPI